MEFNDVIMVLKENETMMREDGGGSQILITAKDGERGRLHRKDDADRQGLDFLEGLDATKRGRNFQRP